MSMSRDGLLPKRFSKYIKIQNAFLRNNCNWFCSSSSSFVFEPNFGYSLCSIGTLFAFVLVCAGVLVLQNKTDIPRGKFKTLMLIRNLFASFNSGLVFAFGYKKATMDFITNETQINNSADIITSLNKEKLKSLRLFSDG
jgi:amino acid transporter